MKHDPHVRPDPHPAHRRRRKLIKPRLQLRLVGTFVALSALGFLLQAQLISSELMKLSYQGPTTGIPPEAIPGLIWRTLAFSFLGLLPLIVAVGILATFRIAGPIYRFERYLADVARGAASGPCTLRRGDELGELCDRINAAVAALREERGDAADDPEERRAA